MWDVTLAYYILSNPICKLVDLPATATNVIATSVGYGFFYITMDGDGKKTEDAAPDEEQEGSDIEMEGMDLEDNEAEEEASPEQGSGEEETKDDLDDVNASALAEQEAAELEQARGERKELLKAEMEAAAANNNKADSKSRIEYLLQQSDVFAHFLAGASSYFIYSLLLQEVFRIVLSPFVAMSSVFHF
jgi:hypothetical protein